MNFLQSFSIPVMVPFLQNKFSRENSGKIESMEFVDAELVSILIPHYPGLNPVVVNPSFGISWGNLKSILINWAPTPEIPIWWGLCISVILRVPQVIIMLNLLNPTGLRLLPRTRISRPNKGITCLVMTFVLHLWYIVF